MSKITLSIDEINNRFILTGDVQEILESRRALRYMKDYLKVEFNGCEEILVSFQNEKKEEVLTNIRNMLRKFDVEENKTQEIEVLLESYFQEEENFKKFSNKALTIKNNDCDKVDFENFIISLIKYLPNRRLYDLQLLSAYHMAFSQNACNFSVPGAGKTSIVYGAYAYLKNLPDNHSKHIEKILIIGPLNSFGPWENEYMECFGKVPSAQRLSGGLLKNEKTQYLYSSITAELTLISYQSVPSVIDDLSYFLRKHKVMVVLDEAHKIKNTDGGVMASAVLKIANLCKSRIVLTGTPAPNGYEDLYNLYKFIWPMHDVVKFHLNQLREMSASRHDQRRECLLSNIDPYFIRIRKSDLNIPAPINNPSISVKMGHYQKYLYEFIEKKYMDYFINQNQGDFKSILTKARMIRLMQAATNPSLLKKPLNEYLGIQSPKDNAFIDDIDIINRIMSYDTHEIPQKFVIAAELIENIIARGEKVIVWMTFIQNILEFKKYLMSRNIESQLLYGDVPVDFEDEENVDDVGTREGIIREFHKDDSDFKVIIANPFAVSESISLHKVCHNAIYVERTFNAAQFIQSKDRIHRYGLKESDKINYYYLIAEGSIDEAIDERLMMKETRMNEIMESHSIPLFDNLSDEYGDEDIKAMIRKYVNRDK